MFDCFVLTFCVEKEEQIEFILLYDFQQDGSTQICIIKNMNNNPEIHLISSYSDLIGKFLIKFPFLLESFTQNVNSIYFFMF